MISKTRYLTIWLVFSSLVASFSFVTAQSECSSPDSEAITTTNAACVERLALTGNSTYNDAAWSPDGQIFAIATSLGISFYDANDLEREPQHVAIDGGVYRIRFSPSGQLLASMGSDGRIWDVTTGELRLVIYERDPSDVTVTDGRYVTNILFSPDEALIGVEGFGIISIWDTATGEQLIEMAGSNLLFTPDGEQIIFSEYDDSEAFLQVLNTDNFEEQEQLSIPLDDFTYQMLVTPDGQRLVTLVSNPNTSENVIHVFSLENGEEIASLDDYTLIARVPMSFNPQGDMIAFMAAEAPYIPGFSGSLRLWDMESEEPNLTIKEYTSLITNIAFSPDGHLIATGEEETFETRRSLLRIWDTTTGEQVAVSEPMIGNFERISFNSDGTQIVTSHGDNILRIWDTSAERIMTLGQGTVNADFTPDASRVLFSNYTGQLSVWSIASDTQVLTMIGRMEVENTPIRAAVIRDDGRKVAFTTGDRFDDEVDDQFHTIQIWDLDTNTTNEIYEDEIEGVGNIAFSPDNQILATAAGNPFGAQTIQLWDVNTGQPLSSPLSGHSDYIVSLAFSPDSQILASGGCGERDVEGVCNNGEIYLWDVSSGQTIAGPIHEHTSAVFALAFSPDGKILASGSGGTIFYGSQFDYTVVLWEVSTWRSMYPPFMSSHYGQIQSLAFNGDSTILAVGTGNSAFLPDSTVRLWDTETGHELIVLEDNNAPVEAVVFNSQGQLLAASHDTTIRLWGIPDE